MLRDGGMAGMWQGSGVEPRRSSQQWGCPAQRVKGRNPLLLLGGASGCHVCVCACARVLQHACPHACLQTPWEHDASTCARTHAPVHVCALCHWYKPMCSSLRVPALHVRLPCVCALQVESIVDKTQELLRAVAEGKEISKADAEAAKKRKLVKPEWVGGGPTARHTMLRATWRSMAKNSASLGFGAWVAWGQVGG